MLAKRFGIKLLSAAHDFGLHDTCGWVNNEIAEHPEIFSSENAQAMARAELPTNTDR